MMSIITRSRKHFWILYLLNHKSFDQERDQLTDIVVGNILKNILPDLEEVVLS